MIPETTLITLPGFALFLLVGFALLIWYPHRLHWLERLALAFLVGVVVVTTAMFWLSAVGISFRLPLLMPLLILGSVASFMLAWWRKRQQSTDRSAEKKSADNWKLRDWFTIPIKPRLSLRVILAFLVILFSSFVIYSAGRHTFQQVHRIPLSRGADVMGRQSSAIEFANQHTVQITGYSLFQISHPEYPLLIPLSSALLLMFAADSPDLYSANIMLLFWAFYAALLCLFLSRLASRTRNLALAMLASAVLSLTPFIFNSSYQYINHFPAAVLFFAGGVYLYRWIEEDQPTRDLWLVGLLLGGFAWTRIEGLMFGVMGLGLAMLYLVYANRIKGQRWLGWQLFLAYGLVAFPWYLYRHLRWSADGRLAIMTSSDLVLVTVNIALIAAYFAFNLLLLKRPLGQWIATRARGLLPLGLLVGGVGTTLLLWLLNPGYTQPRINLLFEKLTGDDWGALLLLLLAVPFLWPVIIKQRHLLILPAWFFVLWAVIYVWDFTRTWPNPNNFAGPLGSSVRSLLYFYPLFLYGMMVLISERVAVREAAQETVTNSVSTVPLDAEPSVELQEA